MSDSALTYMNQLSLDLRGKYREALLEVETYTKALETLKVLQQEMQSKLHTRHPDPEFSKLIWEMEMRILGTMSFVRAFRVIGDIRAQAVRKVHST